MIIHHDIKQRTEEWFDIKKLKFSASNATAIGNNGAGLKTLVDDMILSYLNLDERYTNADMERGNELEDVARTKYWYENHHKFDKSIEFKEVGFVELHCGYVGFSPDAIFFDKKQNKIIGGLEIKARNNKKHFQLLAYDNPESDVIWQCNFAMYVSDCEWWDYISYNPNFGSNSLYLHRILRDESRIKKLITGIEAGEKMKQESLTKLKSKQLVGV